MTSLQETEQLLSKLTRAEKALLVQWLVSDLGDVKSLVCAFGSGYRLTRADAHSTKRFRGDDSHGRSPARSRTLLSWRTIGEGAVVELDGSGSAARHGP